MTDKNKNTCPKPQCSHDSFGLAYRALNLMSVPQHTILAFAITCAGASAVNDPKYPARALGENEWHMSLPVRSIVRFHVDILTKMTAHFKSSQLR